MANLKGNLENITKNPTLPNIHLIHSTSLESLLISGFRNDLKSFKAFWAEYLFSFPYPSEHILEEIKDALTSIFSIQGHSTSLIRLISLVGNSTIPQKMLTQEGLATMRLSEGPSPRYSKE
jgi:hypothetical protein